MESLYKENWYDARAGQRLLEMQTNSNQEYKQT